MEVGRRIARVRAVLACDSAGCTPVNRSFGAWVASQRLQEMGASVPHNALAQAVHDVSLTFDEYMRDPDPLYYLRRALQNVDPAAPDYDSANAMLRTAMENFLIIAANRLPGGQYEGMKGGQGSRRDVLAKIVQQSRLDDTFVDLWSQFLNYLNKNGPHPGAPGKSDDTFLRFNLVCSILSVISIRLRTTSLGTDHTPEQRP